MNIWQRLTYCKTGYW